MASYELTTALDTVIDHVRATRLRQLSAVSLAFKTAWWAADHNSQRDALIAMLEALKEDTDDGSGK